MPSYDTGADPDLEPQVTIIRRETETVEEVRVNGELRYVKVTPRIGPSVLPGAERKRTDIPALRIRSTSDCERRCGFCFPGELNPRSSLPRCDCPSAAIAACGPRMSVYTPVSASELDAWLMRYAVGGLAELEPIASGIENTNYFVTTERGRYVLTLYERLPTAELPFYLNLMAHLARAGVEVPAPIPDRTGALFSLLNGKPAGLVERVDGAPIDTPDARALRAGRRGARPPASSRRRRIARA